jgi:hypothetical protein
MLDPNITTVLVFDYVPYLFTTLVLDKVKALELNTYILHKKHVNIPGMDICLWSNVNDCCDLEEDNFN